MNWFAAVSLTGPSRDVAPHALGFASVVNVVDHQTIGVEVQHRGTGECDRLALFDETCPPLDRSSIARRNGRTESAFHRLFNGELALDIRQSATSLRLAERG